MSHNHSSTPLPYCPNCHYPVAEFDQFCPNCGQKNKDGHVTMHDLWHEVTHYFTHIDGKIIVTLRDMFIPGKLTEAFFKGYRQRYIHPINLFFVVGILLPLIMGSFWKKNLKVTLTGEGKNSEKRQYRKDLLFEMDSTLKQDTLTYGMAIRNEIDSFLFKFYRNSDSAYTKEEATERALSYNFYDTKDNLLKARKAISLLNTPLQLDQTNPNNQVIKQRLKEFQERLEVLKYDSAQAIQKYAEHIGKTTEKTHKRLEMGYMSNKFGRNLYKNSAGIKEQELTLDSILKYPADYDPDKIKNEALAKLIRRDSIRFKDFKIDKIELSTLPEDSLMKKYNITSFKDKFSLRKLIKFGNDGIESAFKNYSQNSLWVTVAGIFPLAWILSLLYRRQKRFYVEHVVFIIHLNCIGFITSLLLLLESNWHLVLLVGIDFTVAVLALKRFYKQGWGKSVLKAMIYYFFNFLFGSILGILGLGLSLIFT